MIISQKNLNVLFEETFKKSTALIKLQSIFVEMWENDKDNYYPNNFLSPLLWTFCNEYRPVIIGDLPHLVYLDYLAWTFEFNRLK